MKARPLLQLLEIPLKGDHPGDAPELTQKVAHILRVDVSKIIFLKVLKRSLDRRSRPIVTRFCAAIQLESQALEEKILPRIPKKFKARQILPEELEPPLPEVPTGHTLIVGAGPAGLMAAWSLILKGQQVTVLERGDDVDRRLPAVGHYWARGALNTESNVCFGEGGAGAFSDGKLVTGNRSPWKQFVLETLVDFGADSSILIDSQAHVGSDRLRRVVKAWREEMIAKGVQFHFRTRVVDLIAHQDEVKGVRLENGKEIFADRVLWAVGGHARDSLEILTRHQVEITPRSLAIGVRVEHPQELVNQALGGYEQGPACDYKLKTRLDQRGVYSFCMCPGGVVVGAASEAGHHVVNGMSCHGKKSRYANSALVVEVDKKEFPPGPLGGLDFQRHFEHQTFQIAENYQAPAQRMTDFLKNQMSSTLPKTSYRPGVVSHNLREILPPDVNYFLTQALPEFARKLKGYVTEEALMIAVETRTSCPLTVKRSADMTATLKNLYCVGEGAGYAGGILSAAYDALNVLNFLARSPN